ncbi:MAG: TraB/GumN family protein [Alphaproteobacteria bacterium]|nr:TraB/GumN family protein [Alphaproteobacteria bacterium]
MVEALGLVVRGFGRWAVLALALVLILSTGANAADAPRVHGQGRLFEILRAGVAPSHVFGTMHSSHPSVLKLSPAVTKALKASRALLVEVVQNEALDSTLAREMVLNDGRTLPDVIGSELMAQVTEAAKDYGLPPENLKLSRPWAIMFMFSVPKSEMERELSGQRELDEALQNYATKQGKLVLGLEQAEELTRFLSGLPDADQAAMLRMTLLHHADIEQVFNDIREAYLKGNLDRLHAMSQELAAGEDTRLNDLFERELIDARNARMAERMMPEIRQGGAFVAVGALHLSGERGILRLLEDAGFRVRRVE